MIKYQIHLMGCFFTLISAGNLFAQTAIKSIDQAGNVTYSERATPDAVSSTEMQIEASPTNSQIEEAEQRAKNAIEQAEREQAERDAQARDREAERKEAAERRALTTPQTIIIENEQSYPVYNPTPGSKPPVAVPPGTGDSQHPIYTPPGERPPIARPLPSPRQN